MAEYGNYINIENSDGKVLKIEVKSTDKGMTKVNIPYNQEYLTRNRLNVYLKLIEDYVKGTNPNAILKPTIKEIIYANGGLYLHVSEFLSPIFMEPGVLNIEISSDKLFTDVWAYPYRDQLIHRHLYGTSEYNKVPSSMKGSKDVYFFDSFVSSLTPNKKYYIRVKYISEAISSPTSDVYEFSYSEDQSTTDSYKVKLEEMIPNLSVANKSCDLTTTYDIVHAKENIDIKNELSSMLKSSLNSSSATLTEYAGTDIEMPYLKYDVDTLGNNQKVTSPVYNTDIASMYGMKNLFFRDSSFPNMIGIDGTGDKIASFTFRPEYLIGSQNLKMTEFAIVMPIVFTEQPQYDLPIFSAYDRSSGNKVFGLKIHKDLSNMSVDIVGQSTITSSISPIPLNKVAYIYFGFALNATGSSLGYIIAGTFGYTAWMMKFPVSPLIQDDVLNLITRNFIAFGEADTSNGNPFDGGGQNMPLNKFPKFLYGDILGIENFNKEALNLGTLGRLTDKINELNQAMNGVIATINSTITNLFSISSNGELNNIYTNTEIGKTIINLSSLYGSKIIPGGDYALNVTCNFDADKNYELTSNTVKFKAPSAIAYVSGELEIIPNKVTTPTPLFKINGEFRVKSDTEDILINDGDITELQWRIYDGSSLLYEKSGDISLKEISMEDGYLESSKNYSIEFRFKHSYFGYSTTLKKEITTSDFSLQLDQLNEVLKSYNNYSYFGEIPTDKLMASGIKYKGVYRSSIAYKKLEEVRHNNKLYICIRNTPNAEYTFSDYFKELSTSEAKGLYGYGLPKIEDLLKSIGLNAKLNNTSIDDEDGNMINLETTYLKIQLPNGNIAYMTKMPVYKNVSINDLIKANIYHPFNKTVRIANDLYYPRLLIKKANSNFDPLQKDMIDKNFNAQSRVGINELNYNEDLLLPMLLDGKLANFTVASLGISNLEFKEILYNTSAPENMKLETVSGLYNMQSIPVSNYDSLNNEVRIILEKITDNPPIRNIHSEIPGDNEVKEDKYDFYSDTAYLGYLNADEFLTSSAIFNRLGLSLGTITPNSGWYKFYHRGLIYFISDGINLKNITFNLLRNNNLAYIHPLITNKEDSVSREKNGKVVFNNLIFNVSLPDIVDFPMIYETKDVSSNRYNIFSVKDESIDLELSLRSMFSTTILNALKDKTITSKIDGYKGSNMYYDFGEIIESIGANESEVLSNNITKEYNVITNSETNPYKIGKTTLSNPSKAILCLSIPAYLNKSK